MTEHEGPVFEPEAVEPEVTEPGVAEADPETWDFRVGQEVQITYTARVVEISGRRTTPGEAGPYLRIETDGNEPTGWIDPSKPWLSIEVVKPPLPTVPGMYWGVSIEEEPDEEYHTDDRRFFYLNTSGKWIDLGWGFPVADGTRLYPLVELPF